MEQKKEEATPPLEKLDLPLDLDVQTNGVENTPVKRLSTARNSIDSSSRKIKITGYDQSLRVQIREAGTTKNNDDLQEYIPQKINQSSVTSLKGGEYSASQELDVKMLSVDQQTKLKLEQQRQEKIRQHQAAVEAYTQHKEDQYYEKVYA